MTNIIIINKLLILLYVYQNVSTNKFKLNTYRICTLSTLYTYMVERAYIGIICCYFFSSYSMYILF